ncbi:MAG: hypothetical protein JJE18_07050 [Eubacteriaceae bacterium]|nr:hypothetical protein [Eubacteriaceae bacterium]
MVNETIETIKTDILANYGNTAYLKMSKNTTFDEAIGTKLWALWYGGIDTVFCVAQLEDEYRKAKRNDDLISTFEEKIVWLSDSLKKEFDKIKNLKKGETL